MNESDVPVIIFSTLYYDIGEDGITWEDCKKMWYKVWEPSLNGEHYGDCTNDPQSCVKCQAEDVMYLTELITG